MTVFSVTLEARAPAANHWRAWRIEAGRDLFGDGIVDVTFGRIGTGGRTVRYAPASEAAARKLVRAALRRRALIDPGGWFEAAQ